MAGKAIGMDVLRELSIGDDFIGVVSSRLVHRIRGSSSKLNVRVGYQG